VTTLSAGGRFDDTSVGPPNPWFSWTWVSKHVDDLVTAGVEHVTITVLSVLIAVVVAFPLALVARRFRRTEGPILAVASVLYTIPALALIGALIPVFGLTPATVIVALAVYALLVLVRNLLVGLDGVPADAVDAAVGMGFSRRRLLWRVELPLALPAIMAGVRVATVSTIGLLTIGGFVGYGGFGNLIFDGFQRSVGRSEVVTAALCCVILALLADLGLLGIQRLLMPWTRRRRGQGDRFDVAGLLAAETSAAEAAEVAR
jgi:osmoprotectant transport system permease protein